MFNVFVDTETTGLLEESRASVVELGAVCLDAEGFEVSSFSSLVRPLVEIGPWADRAMAVNKIPETSLRKAPMPALVWQTFFDWLKLNVPISNVYAYNVNFDRGFLKRSLPLSEHLPWGPCVMLAAAHRIKGPNAERVALSKACTHFGVKNDSAHHAVNDARAAAQVWLALNKG